MFTGLFEAFFHCKFSDKAENETEIAWLSLSLSRGFAFLEKAHIHVDIERKRGSCIKRSALLIFILFPLSHLGLSY